MVRLRVACLISLGCVVVCLQIPKGTTVGKFLEQVRLQLVQEFADVRSLGSDDLMYIKEDLIIPHVRHASPCRTLPYTMPTFFGYANDVLSPGRLVTAHPCAV